MTDPVTALNHAMNNDLYRLNAISHNLANVNTSGYKTQISVFSGFEWGALEQGTLEPGMGSINTSGSSLRQQIREFSQGTLKHTRNDFDLALDGPGFLLIENKGETLATRAGKLTLAMDGKLMTVQGQTVQGENGPIFLQAEPFMVYPDGRIEQDDQVLAQLKLVEFGALGKLHYRGAGLYEYTEETLLKPASLTRVKQGYQETSNVDSMAEMVKLIEATRHFEASHQVLKGYDEMLNSAINILAEF